MASRLIARRLLTPTSRLSGVAVLPGGLVSWFSSASGSSSPDAAEVARALRCQDFQRGPLQSLAVSRPTVPYTELLDIIMQQ